jgi:hypothetical protein
MSPLGIVLSFGLSATPDHVFTAIGNVAANATRSTAGRFPRPNQITKSGA